MCAVRVLMGGCLVVLRREKAEAEAVQPQVVEGASKLQVNQVHPKKGRLLPSRKGAAGGSSSTSGC